MEMLGFFHNLRAYLFGTPRTISAIILNQQTTLARSVNLGLVTLY